VKELGQLRALAKRSPNNPEIRLPLAQAYLRFGHLLSARAEFEAALAARADEWLCRSGIAAADLRLQRFDLAEKELQRLLQLKPGALRTHLAIADARLQSGDAAGSRRILDGIPRDPQGVPQAGDPAVPSERCELLATAYGALGDWKQACTLAKLSETLEPGRLSAKIMQGRALHALGRYNEAEPLLKLGVETDPSIAEIHYLYGTCLARKSPPAARATVHAALVKAVDIDKQHAKAWLELGRIDEAEGRLSKAAEAFQLASLKGLEGGKPMLWSGDLVLKLGEKEEGWYRRGRYFESSGQFEKAIAEYTKLTTMHDCCRSGYMHLARTYQQMGRHELAVQYLEKAQQLEPARAAELDWAVCQNLLNTKEIAKRDNKLKQLAESSHPDAVEAQFQLGVMADGDGDFDKAEQWLRRALKNNPKDGVICLSLGKTLLQRRTDPKRLQEAVRMLETAVTLAPDNAEACYRLGLAYGYTGETEKQIFALRHAVDLSPENGNWYQTLGQALAKAGDKTDSAAMLSTFQRFKEFEQTRETLKARAERNRKDASALAALAEFHFKAQEYPASIVAYSRYLRMKPGDTDARRRMAAAYGYLGRHSEEKAQLAMLVPSSARKP
jgi:tetratricopeptide (TPR) repeat protein